MSEPSIPAGARIGHILLKVGNLDRQIGFYRDFLGFDLLMRFIAHAVVPWKGRM